MAIVLPVVTAVVSTGYLITSRMLTQQIQATRERIEISLGQTLRLADRGTALAGSVLEMFERPALARFNEVYAAAGSVDEIDLAALRDELREYVPSQLAEEIDLYIIDRSGIVVATTYETDLGLDFSQYRSFFSSIEALFDEGGFRTDDLRPEIITGSIRRFSYLRTDDARYILELGISAPVLAAELAEFGESAEALVAEGWQLVTGIQLYTSEGTAVDSLLAPTVGSPVATIGPDPHDTPLDHPALVAEALQTNEILRYSSNDGNTLYSLIPVRINRASSLEPTDRVIEVAFDLTSSRALLQRLLVGYVFGALGFILVALILGLRLVHRMTFPLIAITEEIAAIGAGDLDRRIETLASGEVGILKDSVNTMVERLVASQRALERTVEERNESLRHVDGLSRIGRIAAAVAHDLSTPLSVALQALTYQASEIREKRHLLAQEADNGAGARVLENLLESSNVGSRSLARAASVLRSFKRLALGRPQGDEATFDVVEVTRDVAITLEVIARRAGIAINVSQRQEDIDLHGVEGAYAQLMANLIENAIRHAFPSGWSPKQRGASKTISIEVSADPDTITVIVEDNGIGVPVDIRRRVFEPFYTTKPDEGGTGLGLAIARDVTVNVLGGEIEIGEGDDGGARFTIRLPHRTLKDAVMEHD